MSGMRFEEEHEHDDTERWLLTYADMITLLLALFIVMFAMSSVNATKFQSLQQSLQDAFSGKILGGEAIKQTGGSVQAEQAKPEVSQTTLQPMAGSGPAARLEQTDFRKLKAQIDKLIGEQGLTQKVETAIEKRGLAVRVLTDGLLFDSGSAVVKSGAVRTLERIGRIIAAERRHPVQVEGHTDDRPINTAQYPSNWQLSGARAAAVVQQLNGAGVSGKRMSLAGHAAQHPVAGNATPAGRAQNRRVEIILTRLHGATSSHGGDK